MVDSTTNLLLIGANSMSLSLLQRTQVVLKDTVIQIHKLDFCFKSWTCLHIFYLSEDQNLSILPQA